MKIDSVLEWVKELIEQLKQRGILIAIFFATGVVLLLAAAVGWPFWLDASARQPLNPPYDVVFSGAGFLLFLVSFWFMSKLESHQKPKAKNYLDVPQDQPKSKGCSVRIIPSAAEADVEQYIREVVESSTDVEATLIGTGLAVLQTGELLSWLLDKVKQGNISSLKLILANPSSPAVRMRLIEEQCAHPRPTIGLHGLEPLISAHLDQMRDSGLSSQRVSMSLFSNYPTFALIKVGSNYLIYNYSYAHLGHFSPAICFDNGCKTLAHFCDEHRIRVESAAMDAKEYFSLDEGSSNQRTRSLYGFAVYFIPEGRLYQVGSSILGYDIRTGKDLDSEYSQFAGDAKHFGFHLTIADALWVVDPKIIEDVERLIDSMLLKSDPIVLQYYIEAGFPDKHSISLRCSPNEQLKELHRRLVEEVYPLAIGSNYTLGSAKLDRCYCENPERNRAMMRMFYAPYILDCYEPHFTLLSNVPEDRVNDVADRLAVEFPMFNSGEAVVISQLSVMRRLPKTDYWQLPLKDISVDHRSSR